MDSDVLAARAGSLSDLPVLYGTRLQLFGSSGMTHDASYRGINPESLRIAYADPPYPGQSKRWYGDHKDYGGEVDHAELVARLATYDGWALSTSAAALRAVLPLCPDDVRVAVWYRQNSEHPGNRGTWWWSWEPVIVSPARAPEIATRDMLSHHKEQGFLGSTIPGQKPKAVCQWIFALVGLRPEDELVDMFPGSGAVGLHWETWKAQQSLFAEAAS